jgi:hypothetical protein
VGIELGVVVFDLSDLGKTGKANSFILMWLRQVESLLCQLRKAILSNSQQFYYFGRTTVTPFDPFFVPLSGFFRNE